ncbi:outer membrane protein [Bradyrhizobium sp. CCBAU 45389]|uniref:outer membrane protein n=1 Tax=Bradyrhizobium sp. CCBAU 45389 TaxID=858429 RepID=UPI002304E8A3|nr:outer membrane protein [Bradyrhizobium sp. CCBAU 45389]MDA9402542.1 membrane protein [Bradyrhizobium sp. CCBAU 45389]
MRRLAAVGVGLVSILGFGSAAGAADLAVKAPVAAKQFSWTGCFIGVHAGGDFSYDKIRSSGDFSSAGFIGGGQIGCDYQFASAWVIGVEGRAAWSSLTSKTPGTATFNPVFGGVVVPLTVPTQFTVSNDFLASATARLGYSFAGNWLAYGRGGVAWTREKADIVLTPPLLGVPVDPKGTMTRTGWTAGVGLDWAFASHWSANFAYDYYDFGANDFVLTNSIPPVTVSGSLKDRVHTVTAGVNYRF